MTLAFRRLLMLGSSATRRPDNDILHCPGSASYEKENNDE